MQRATQTAQVDLVLELLQRGANPRAKTVEGYSALHLATEIASTKLIDVYAVVHQVTDGISVPHLIELSGLSLLAAESTTLRTKDSLHFASQKQSRRKRLKSTCGASGLARWMSSFCWTNPRKRELCFISISAAIKFLGMSQLRQMPQMAEACINGPQRTNSNKPGALFTCASLSATHLSNAIISRRSQGGLAESTRTISNSHRGAQR